MRSQRGKDLNLEKNGKMESACYVRTDGGYAMDPGEDPTNDPLCRSDWRYFGMIESSRPPQIERTLHARRLGDTWDEWNTNR